jgi:L-aspartate oxidase
MGTQTQHNFDFLVIGSGIAGLSYALKVCRVGTVAIITKKKSAESNTNMAQGGIAAVMSAEDSLELHVRDTLMAGDGLCREEVVRTIITEGPGIVKELAALGVKFTERESPPGVYDLGREGGHTKRRVLHAGDITGREIERALLAAVAAEKNITMLENQLAVDLITTWKLQMTGPNRCLGVYVLDEFTGAVNVFAGRVTLLATGGSLVCFSFAWMLFLLGRFRFCRLSYSALCICTRAIRTSPAVMGWRWRTGRV